MRRTLRALTALLVLDAAAAAGLAAEFAGFTRKEVIYGRKDGLAMTLDVLAPRERANGAAAIWVVSGGWFSSHDAIQPAFVMPLLSRGYTVFAVVHGSQPRYAIPDAAADLARAVRFVRAHAKEYAVDVKRFGVTGASAGGHLSLMLGTTGDDGDPKAKDPVERASSRVQAVACFFPPTDFLNYGQEGNVNLGTGTLVAFKAPFDFREIDPKTRSYVPIDDAKRRLELGRTISPVNHVSRDDAPTLIIHGDADKLVPIQQARRFLDRLEKAKVPAELVVRSGAEHGWPTLPLDVGLVADWFDKQLPRP